VICRAAFAGLLLVSTATAADARRHRHVSERHIHDGSYVEKGLGIVHVETAAGKIKIAERLAAQFAGLIADLTERGFTGEVGCYARSGHMRRSRHYAGAACDFAQRARNLTTDPLMYVSRDLIEAHGLRDGCTFRRPDCAHVDDGRSRGR